MLDQLRFSITADQRTAAAMAQVRSQLTGVKGVLADVRDYANRAGRTMRNIGVGMTAGVTAPMGLMAKQSIQLYDTQIKAQAAVEQVVASTGGAAGKTADELFRAASGLQAMTTYGDEDILQNVTAPLLTFTQVSGDVFDRAQANVLDMATLMKMDLKSASVLVGKALNDPVAGLSALSRTGVQFSEDQKNVIKSLVETGDVAAAQSLILSELETQFGGQAAAAARTPLGQWSQLSNAIGDVKEQLGEQIVPFLTPLVETVKSAVDWFGQLDPEVKKNIVIFGGLAAAAGPVLLVLGTMTMGLGGLVSGLSAMGAVLMANPIFAAIGLIAGGAYLIWRNWEPISAFFVNLWGQISSGAAAGWDMIKSIFLNYTAAGLIYQHWDGISSWFSARWDEVRAGVSVGWSTIAGIFKAQFTPAVMIYSVWAGLPDWFNSQFPLVSQAFQDGWTAIKAEVATWPAAMIQSGRDIIQGLIDGINEKYDAAVARVRSIGSDMIGGIKDILSIRSPSREFHQIGADTMAGLGLGISDNAAIALDPLKDVGDQLKDVGSQAGQIDGMGGQLFASLTEGAEGFRSALSQVLGQLAQMTLTTLGTNLFSSAGIGSAVSGLLGIGAVGSPVLGLPSFAGGGYTGGGARSGGMDGKGGFMAMLHPNETVIDHTRNAPNAQGVVTLRLMVPDGITLEQVDQRAAGIAVEVVRENNARMADSRARSR
ncbi:hypothetical protein LGQ03_07185 [Loktanella sp. TSTF-M6]|uniref:Uncharacterized protein n=1 Tax=Loktanella gaetbuli TaxID=2881335 RepID=A0ABS8BTW7_9RHOB|nr:hypothetical protein [Loktanella gaetbuli]MCB5199019.1 hypothetical protein [Loktanella gaetbuli]